jgi:hypothetical protein
MSRYKKYFINAIREHFPDSFIDIINDSDNHYLAISKDTEFAKTSSNPIDKRLDFCTYFLALIISLDKLGLPYERIRRICLEITTEYVRPKNRLQQLLKRLPPKLTNTWLSSVLLKMLTRKLVRTQIRTVLLLTLLQVRMIHMVLVMVLTFCNAAFANCSISIIMESILLFSARSMN